MKVSQPQLPHRGEQYLPAFPCPRRKRAITLIHVRKAHVKVAYFLSFPDHLGHRAQDVAALPHFTLQVKEHEGSSKEGRVFIQQELPTGFIFLHVSSQKQLSQPPGTSHSFSSSSALFVERPCSHILNSSLHRDKLSMLSLVMLQGGGRILRELGKQHMRGIELPALHHLVLVPLCFNGITHF